MTREEAAGHVRDAFEAWYSEYSVGDDWTDKFKAMNMAIEALEQPADGDTNQNADHGKMVGDTISRQAAIDAIQQHRDGILCSYDEYYEDIAFVYAAAHSRIINVIKKLPSAQPERNTGRWIWQTEDKYECSCCHEVIQVKEVMNVPQYITCPMCDAKMEAEHE